jgi:hypothetical protein
MECRDILLGCATFPGRPPRKKQRNFAVFVCLLNLFAVFFTAYVMLMMEAK